jgi:hypothetical protein
MPPPGSERAELATHAIEFDELPPSDAKNVFVEPVVERVEALHGKPGPVRTNASEAESFSLRGGLNGFGKTLPLSGPSPSGDYRSTLRENCNVRLESQYPEALEPGKSQLA